MIRRLKQAFSWLFSDSIYGRWMTIGGVIILALPPYTWFSNVCGGLAFVTGVGFLVIAHREKKKLESK